MMERGIKNGDGSTRLLPSPVQGEGWGGGRVPAAGHFPLSSCMNRAVPAGGTGHRVLGCQPWLGKDVLSPGVLLQGRDIPVPCPQWHRGQRLLTSMAGMG